MTQPTEYANRQLWLMPDSGEARTNLVALAALRVRSFHPYSYRVPPALRDRLIPGAALRVPYGRAGREVEGFCIGVSEKEWDQTLKEPIDAVAPVFELPVTLAQLGLWISDYYFCPPGTTFSLLLPAAVRAARSKTIRVVRRAAEWSGEAQPTPKQQRVLSLLDAGEREWSELLRSAEVGGGVVKKLAERGWVTIASRVTAPRPPADVLREQSVESARNQPEDGFALTADQSAALAVLAGRLAQPQFEPFLLFGVPGSGKTEVYVRAIRAAIEQGRQAILMVPEIALATQIVDRLARRFPRVAVMHSALSPRARADALRVIAAGGVEVVIGTRTAVFAPLPRLGLIIVDEEQEGSYKHLASPLFHARDVAIKRAQLESIPVVLGSATPSLETWHHATVTRKYRLLELRERVPGAEFPRAQLIEAAPRDAFASEEDEKPSDELLSPALRTALVETLRAGHQAIILQNRRGYATALRCEKCTAAVRCPQCFAYFVYHHGATPFLQCRRCGVRESPAPAQCPDAACRGPLAPSGMAIQKLEEELRAIAPQARLLRLDGDTMRRREDYSAAMEAFEQRAADVMLGTQMVAKGLDFPAVRLVGVVDATAALRLPDPRAAEHVFQLIMQVVGGGGGAGGESLALVQCDANPPDGVRAALEMDYRRFADAELLARQRMSYPPVVRFVRIVVADSRAGVAKSEAEAAQRALGETAWRVAPDIRIDEPTSCTFARIREMNRVQILLRSSKPGTIQRVLRAALEERIWKPKAEKVTIDVDPLDFM